MTLPSLLLEGKGAATLQFPDENASIRPGPAAVAGSQLWRRGGPEPAVAALLTNDLASVQIVLGGVHAGGRVVSLPLPSRGMEPLLYASFVRDAVAGLGCTQLVARDDLALLLQSAGVPCIGHTDLARYPGAEVSTDFELVQYTSGATGSPRPLLIDGSTLHSNLLAIRDRVEPQSGDVTVSWLPLSHDMGLIGMLMASLASAEPTWRSGADLVLFPPETFLRSPKVWLEAIDHWRGTFTAAPDFGYRMAFRSPLTNLDLSSVRTAIVGGEVVRRSTLETVQRFGAPATLSPTALAPAYGMAELGLAASITPTHELWRSATRDGFDVVSSGPPLEGYTITSGVEGQLTIRAPGYAADAISGELLVGHGQGLETNDVGFVDEDGWIYVTGRVDDIIVAHGRNISGVRVEEALSSVPGVREGRTTATGLPSGEWILAIELDRHVPAEDQPRIRSSARSAAIGACGIAPDHVVLLAPGSLPMTSSGKVRRSEVRTRWTAGTLGV